jgi:hypothetical protein
VPTDEQNIDKSMEFVAKAKMIGKYLADNATGASTVYEEVPKEYYDTPSIFGEPRQEPLMAEIDAWHGSPHFFDKFKMSKIGTGEGVQAFGHGLYFTDKKEIAKHYAQSTSRGSAYRVDRVNEAIRKLDDNAAQRIAEYSGLEEVRNADDLIEELEMFGDQWYYDIVGKEMVKEGLLSKPGRNVYKTTLFKGKDPSEYTFLDWYEKVPEEKIGAIRKLAKEEGLSENQLPWQFSSGMSDKELSEIFEGREIYREIANRIIRKDTGKLTDKGKPIYYNERNDKEASLFLKRAGIDGIRYPTESLSGVKNSGKNNYVIFDENAIHIDEVKRY